MTVTVTPTAIDALIPIESIQVIGRHRYALGNLRELADSIDDVGLLNPITLTRDSRLIAGQRRLEACRLLRWVEVPVRFVDSLDDAAKLLRAERDENTCRKDMLPSEKAALGEALLSIEAQRAKERQLNGLKQNRSGEVSLTESEMSYGQARDAVGAALGMSGRVYGDLRGAYTLATDPDVPEAERELAKTALGRMDSGTGIQSAAEDMRRQLRAKRGAQLVKPAAQIPDTTWRRTPSNAAERYAKMRDLAESGHSAAQIADLLGYASADSVRQTAREQGITIPADRVMGRSPKSIDSNRIVRETVQTVADLGTGLKLVDYDELDPEEVGDWTASLSESIRMLNRLNKRLKEVAQ